jgi:hypothetical protein
MFAINNRKNRTVVVAVTAILVVLGGSLAYAYWTSTGGAGTGTATTGTSSAFVVTQTGATGPDLRPGVGTQSIDFTVTNPLGNATQTLNAVTASIKESNGDPWTSVAGCSAADYTVGTVTAITAGPMIAGASQTGHVTLTMVNSLSNQDACKNADVPLYFATN